MGDQELGLWSFVIVAPPLARGIVSFNLALSSDVRRALRNNDRPTWAVLLNEVDGQANEKIADALSEV